MLYWIDFNAAIDIHYAAGMGFKSSCAEEYFRIRDIYTHYDVYHKQDYKFLDRDKKIEITSKKEISCGYTGACICAAALSYLYLEDINIAVTWVAIFLGKYIWFIDEKSEKKAFFRKDQNYIKRIIAIFAPIGIMYAVTGALAYFIGRCPIAFSGACFGSAAAGFLAVYVFLKNEKRLKSNEKESSS